MSHPIIVVETVPHGQQPYNTCGFYGTDNGAMHVTVSMMPDWKYTALVAIHEIIEATICRSDGVTDDEITAFDVAFTGDGEPGDDPAAPYRRQHLMATAIEKMLAAAMGVDWKTYESAIDAL